ncbi:MAG: DUF3347 domain-containing protein [Chitinophagales bacterium]|jgi:hypothetical protein|nr:DUF3347 domain-containing protein [Chitinophagales bacterium]MCO5281793.1 DUF3347 domain-containing protein [Chitinophagales bacterium]OJV30749.1 MAG: hypothetical protein BGO32_09630 [Bacteroidetes bacterium 37-13]HRP40248.1 DUF3347 domain-containing protein [Chitinophagales bacterium]
MKNLLLVFAFVTFGIFSFAQNSGNPLNSYYNVKDALVKSDGKGASVAIQSFQKDVSNDATLSKNTALVNAIAKFAAAKNVEKQRAVFNELSTNFWDAVKAQKGKQTVYYQYCPMKKGYWLSQNSEILNPYYGSSMLNCGKVVETLNK